MRYFSSIIFLAFMIVSCGKETLPKPVPYLKLQYPEAIYKKIESNGPFTFEISDQAKINFKNKNWASIEYPQLKATVHLTYRPINNDLDEILKEVEKLTFEHTIKADAINAVPYENSEKRVFAKLYNIEGSVATNIQFRATDSLKHVLSGALYFYTRPNYDSIVPAIKYVEKDIIHLIETLEWKNQQ
ncbi:MAG: gliding motility lipoprotein GldD [Lutibacter sp.]|nr:gliding motility lipoprotein GldD [Lutibacter sp.]MDP3360075.1 gliding motility lipoprotein GldD [Lutibacter sp.]